MFKISWQTGVVLNGLKTWTFRWVFGKNLHGPVLYGRVSVIIDPFWTNRLRVKFATMTLMVKIISKVSLFPISIIFLKSFLLFLFHCFTFKLVEINRCFQDDWWWVSSCKSRGKSKSNFWKSLPEGPCKALAKSDCYNEASFVITVSRLFFSIF